MLSQWIDYSVSEIFLTLSGNCHTCHIKPHQSAWFLFASTIFITICSFDSVIYSLLISWPDENKHAIISFVVVPCIWWIRGTKHFFLHQYNNLQSLNSQVICLVSNIAISAAFHSWFPGIHVYEIIKNYPTNSVEVSTSYHCVAI